MPFSKFCFLSSILFTLVLSCQGDKKDEIVSDKKKEADTFWADSVLQGLSDKQKYYQHLIIEVPSTYQAVPDSLVKWIAANQPGAIHFLEWNADSITKIKIALDTLEIIHPIFYADYFSLMDAEPYPFWEVNDELLHPDFFKPLSKASFSFLNFSENIRQTDKTKKWLDTLTNRLAITPITNNFSDKDAAEKFDEFLNAINSSSYGIQLNLQVYDSVHLENYRSANNFEGVFFVRAKEQAINLLLENGSDFVFRRLEAPETYEKWKPSNTDIFNLSTKRILQLKSKVDENRSRVNLAEGLHFIRLNFQAKTTSLVSNDKKLIPFSSKFTIYSEEDLRVREKIRKDCGVSIIKKDFSSKVVSDIVQSKGNKVILLSDTASTDVLDEVKKIKTSDNTLVVFRNEDQFDILKDLPHLLFSPQIKLFDTEILVQQLSSRLKLKSDFFTSDSLYKGNFSEKKVLARTDANFVGLDEDTLSRISGLMNNCMSNRAFPGGQVLIAKDGCIIYDRVFGKHSYQGQTLVTENTLYDLASITKVVATTLVGMKLYEMGLYEMDDSLEMYLPDSLRQHLKFPSTIRHITFQEIYTHTSGLPSGFPIIKYMRYVTPEVGRFDRFFCDRSDSVYCVEVAEGFYLEKEQQDSMWLRMNQIYLDPAKPYNYSDVNMNLLYMMLKSFIDKEPSKFGFTQTKKQLKDKNLFEEFLYQTFYVPLGMKRTCYRPLKKFSRDVIAPTENETYWRKQLIHGHVHDPNAALMGGVAGNAGIFSTANDLIILFQMWLNKGVYNGKRYLKAETVDKFTARQENCFRGLGFNKPSMGSTSFGMSENASLSTYGHTGFTGTAFWIDPEYNLIYIYLSNAVHPSVNNKTYEYGIRKKVHQCAYDAMMTEEF